MHIHARFYETYNICSIVDGMLKNRFDWLMEMEGFYCDGQWSEWLVPYQKYSVFHRFIGFVVHDLHHEQAVEVKLVDRKKTLDSFSGIPEAIADIRPQKLPIEDAFDHHGIDHLSFKEHLAEAGKSFRDADDDDVYGYMSEIWISAAYEELMGQMVAEAFHVLFQNRQLLLLFNDFVSSILTDANHDDAEELDRSLLAPNGTLLRVRPPKWAQRAVFYRDRGRCVLCDTDLSGLVNLENQENYDHIVALALFGLNDISNLQLLCARCNQIEKRDGHAVTSSRYQAWYSANE